MVPFILGGTEMAPLEKEAPFPTFFFKKTAPLEKEEPKQCQKGVRSADKKMVPLRSRFGSSFFSECIQIVIEGMSCIKLKEDDIIYEISIENILSCKHIIMVYLPLYLLPLNFLFLYCSYRVRSLDILPRGKRGMSDTGVLLDMCLTKLSDTCPTVSYNFVRHGHRRTHVPRLCKTLVFDIPPLPLGNIHLL